MDNELTPREQARLETVTDVLVSRAAAEGLKVNRADLAHLPVVRMAILTDLGLDENAMADVRRIPGVAAQIQTRETARALENGDSAVHAELANMTAYQRMEFGRKLDAARMAEKAAQPKPVMTAEDEVKILTLLRNLPPAARLAAARAAGFGV